MTIKQYKRACGVFPNHQDTELALRKLRLSHFPMDNVSVMAQDKNASHKENELTRKHIGNHASEGAGLGVMTGGALGGITGLLVGLGTVAIPGIGPIMLAGAAATTIATTIASSAIGAVAGSLVGGLIGLGIPEERARFYKQRIKQGDYLVIIEGTEDEIRLAQAILKDCGIKEWEIYDVDVDVPEPITYKEYMRGIGAFSERDRAEVALLELIDAGFPINQVTLITSNETDDEWVPNLIVHCYLDNTHFVFPEERRQFFQNRFDRGEYLLMIDGIEDEFHRAEKILGRCGIEGFYIYDPSLSDAVPVPVINDQPKLTDAVPVPVINDQPKITESQRNVSSKDINNEEKVIAPKKYAVVDSDSRVVIIDHRVKL